MHGIIAEYGKKLVRVILCPAVFDRELNLFYLMQGIDKKAAGIAPEEISPPGVEISVFPVITFSLKVFVQGVKIIPPGIKAATEIMQIYRVLTVHRNIIDVILKSAPV